MTIVNIVVINGEEILLESLPNKEEIVDKINIAALREKNYEVEKTA